MIMSKIINKIIYFTILIITLLILNSCKSIDLMKHASNAYNNGKYSLSYFFVKKQLKKDASDINAIELKSLIEEMKNDYLSAKETYNKILLMGYESPSIFNSYGDLLYKTGNLYAAMHYFNKAYSIDSTLLLLNFNLAVIYFVEFDSLETALSYINRELVNNKDNISSLLLKCDILLKMQEYNKATDVAHQVLQINSKEPEAYVNLGRVNVILDNYKEALKQFNIAISINDREASYFLRRGSTYALLKDYESALKDFSHAIRIDNSYIAAYQSRIRINSEYENYKQICRDIRKIERLDNQLKGLYDYHLFGCK